MLGAWGLDGAWTGLPGPTLVMGRPLSQPQASLLEAPAICLCWGVVERIK